MSVRQDIQCQALIFGGSLFPKTARETFGNREKHVQIIDVAVARCTDYAPMISLGLLGHKEGSDLTHNITELQTDPARIHLPEFHSEALYFFTCRA